ncbi:MAG: hypothetical protein EP343_24620 [Deltaproteobacteria bacterium]|nr:MAG: hypothetical protein EP343_24620 [Deltaproteobacteria bacterium]
MNRKSWIVVLGMCCVMGLTGCFSLGEPPTQGEQSRVEFSFRGGLFSVATPGCFFGCSLRRAMVVGAQEKIGTQSMERAIPVTQAKSSDPSVFQVQSFKHNATCCTKTQGGESCSSSMPCTTGRERHSYTFEVKAVASGSAKLQLLGADGSVYDSVVLRVAKPTRVEVVVKEVEGDEQEKPLVHAMLKANKSYHVTARAFDESDSPMQVGKAVTMTLSSSDVAVFEGGLLLRKTTTTARQDATVRMICNQQGKVELTVDVAGIKTQIPLQIQK